MALPGEWSMSEIVRSLQRIEQTLASLPTRIEQELKFQTLDERVSGLETAKEWAVRLVLGFVVVGVLSAAFVTKAIG